MSVAPDPAELAPSRDPAAYGRRPLFTAGFFVWVLLCLACLAIGGVAGRFAFPAEPTAKPQIATPDTPARPASIVVPPLASGPAPAPPASSAPTASVSDMALADRVSRLESAASRQSQAAAET